MKKFKNNYNPLKSLGNFLCQGNIVDHAEYFKVQHPEPKIGHWMTKTVEALQHQWFPQCSTY